MRNFVLGMVVGFVLLITVVFAYFLSGSAPVATDSAPMPMEKYLAKKALHAVLDREMPKSVPIPAGEATFLAGAQVYKDHCAVCHGIAGRPATAIARGMFPKPPELMLGKGVTDDEPGETYWKVEHGIRLTGMPGFKATLTETQAWQVSLLLANADKLPPPARTLLASPAAPEP